MKNIFLSELRDMSLRRMSAASAFVAAILVFYILQLALSNQSGLFSNWVVPDGISLHEALKQLVSGSLNTDELQAGWAAFAFYYPSKWLGVAAYVCINLVCLLVIGWRLGFISLILFPYFLVAAALPSKDILILLVSLLFLTYLVNGHWFIGFLIALFSYFIRDGSMFVLVSVFFSYQIIQRNIIAPSFLVAIALIFGALFLGILNDVFGDMFIVARNFSVYEQNSSALLGYGTWFDYFVRVFGNATNLAFRPSLIDENGGISILGVGYLISGISVLTSLICSVHTIACSKNGLAVNLSVALLISLSVISLNPFIQGRYLFPFCVILLGYLIGSGKLRYVLTIYLLSISLALLATVAYAYSSIPGTPPNGVLLFSLLDSWAN